MRTLDRQLAELDSEGMRVQLWSYRDRIALIGAVVLPCGVAAAFVPLRGHLVNTDAALVLVVAVVAVAANGHRVAGILAAISAAMWFDFFLTQPYEHFTITRGADVRTTVLLLAVGAAVTELAVHGRRQRSIAVIDGAYLAAIGSTAELAGNATNPGELIDHVCSALTSVLGLRSCRFERFRFGGLARLEPDGRLLVDGGYWDLNQYGMPRGEIELLANSADGSRGRFVLEATAGTLPSLEALQVAQILARQVGAALVSVSARR
jgi:hypothetical protein